MSKHGFVYILGNAAMPGRYKVGFTTQSPFRRAEELSRATGVPCEFTVIGFGAFSDPQSVEAWMHRRFEEERCGKEFFQCPAGVLWDALRERDDRDALCDVEVSPWDYDDRPEFYQREAS